MPSLGRSRHLDKVSNRCPLSLSEEHRPTCNGVQLHVRRIRFGCERGVDGRDRAGSKELAMRIEDKFHEGLFLQLAVYAWDKLCHRAVDPETDRLSSNQ